MRHALLALLCAISACEGNVDPNTLGADDGGSQGDGDGRGDGGGQDGDPSGMDGGVELDSGVEISPFGLDERPANPTCVAPEKPSIDSAIGTRRVFAGLSLDRPLAMVQAPGRGDAFYVIEQTGAVKRFPNRDDVGDDDVRVVLDVGVRFDGNNDERGLLGIAFHPNFAENGFVFVHYVRDDGGSGTSTVDRYTWNEGRDEFDEGTRKNILELRQPFSNHNGGHLAFGHDGLLYLGFGDGGSQDDPMGNGQDTSVLFGKMLRIDVDRGDPYAIPPGNPFASSSGDERKEIFAWGLRNPWRYSFDRETGELWVGDVGGGCWEEVNVLEVGKNYGWSRREGFFCRTRECGASSDCESEGLVDPVAAYGHDLGQSITGGYVYRGAEIEAVRGTYLYGDFASGRIWGVTRTGDGYQDQELLNTDFAISSFAEDVAGELYVLNRGFEANQGQIHRIIASESAARDTLPKTLSATGCFESGAPTTPVAGLVPYALRVPFWSDGAQKERWLALPDDTQLGVEDDGDFVLPPGGVTVKEFQIDARRVETRFFVRFADGSYGGYTYRWRDDQSDADLLPGRGTVQVGEQTWTIPNRGECDRCHHPVAGSSLGLEVLQLDGLETYPSTGRTSNQLDTLAHIGMLASRPRSRDPELPRLSDQSVDVRLRARAWLHENCSNCHRPGGPGRGTADLRFEATDLGVCNVEPIEGDLGVAGARLLVPGSAEQSLIYLRMNRRGDDQMPPLASDLVDEQGRALLESWIDGLSECP